jgi:FMN-dependent NADH-azoreductase
MKLLHLDSSILGPHSVTREMSGKIVSQLAGSDPTIEVVYRDLVEDGSCG